MDFRKYLNKTELLDKAPLLGFLALAAVIFGVAVKAKFGALLCLIWGTVFVIGWSYNRLAAVIGPFIVFTLYLYAERFTHGKISLEILAPYLALSMALVFLLAGLGQVAKGRAAPVFAVGAGLVLFALSLPAAFFLIHLLVFGVPVSPDVFFAIGQTNFVETRDFVMQFIGVLWALPIIAFAALFIALFYRERKRAVLPMSMALVLLMVMMGVIGFKGSEENFRLVQSAKNYARVYAEELELFQKAQSEKKENHVKAAATDTGQTAVLVIGEALNKRHMELYGYGRDTTPELSKLYSDGEIVRLDNFYSSHTHTMPTLSLALTEANLHNGKSYTVSPTIIDVARSAGYETWWISNQALMGRWDNLVSVIANTADHLVPLNKNVGATTKTHNFDGAVVGELEKILKTPAKGNRLVIIHLMGSHGGYCDRFPKGFDKFDGSKNRQLDCYDNSVLYNDTNIKNIIDVMKKDGGKSFMFYFSDHAEDVYGEKGHASTQFTYEMTYIPGIAWFSPSYKSGHAKNISHFSKNAGRLFSNEYTYDTMIDFMGVKTSAYDPQSSIAGAAYNADNRPAYILEKKKNYRDPENLLYHLGDVHDTLVKNGQEGRIVSHRVNTLGKFNEVMNAGFRDFELDLYFNETKHRFEVGHDAKTMTGLGLEDFLGRAPAKGFDKIWFDIKNLTVQNVDDVKVELERLNKLYGVKNFAIVETGLRDDAFAKLSDFHTSYYLPTNAIEDMLEAKDEAGMAELADKIAAQAKAQKIHAVSFDISLYPFVKNHLGPKLPPSVVYHTWDTDLSMKETGFIQELTAKAYYSDKRIKTILVSFPSRFTR